MIQSRLLKFALRAPQVRRMATTPMQKGPGKRVMLGSDPWSDHIWSTGYEYRGWAWVMLTVPAVWLIDAMIGDSVYCEYWIWGLDLVF